MDLTDRTAIVTGASSGAGAAIASRLAEAGCRVTLAARREDRLQALADEMGPDRTLVAPTDVTDADAVETMVERTREAFGGFDLLVNNAGVLIGDPVAEADREEQRAQIEVNLLGVMTVTHAALPTLLEAEAADVVTVSSLNARYPSKGGSAYTASKFGVNGFCRSLRRELADEQVRVTIVMPGPIVSEMKDWADWEGRALQPEDIAETVVFAASRPDHVEITDISIDSTDKFD